MKTMGDIYDLTPKDIISKAMLEEKVFKTWYHGWNVLLGDAYHKLHPSGAHGVVSALHAAIALAHLLLKMRFSSAPSLFLITLTLTLLLLIAFTTTAAPTPSSSSSSSSSEPLARREDKRTEITRECFAKCKAENEENYNTCFVLTRHPACESIKHTRDSACALQCD
ncbi:hypothetical protein BKA57DRAFT_531912 [Linnemannia elongata]|nr:hypothetical protein BKA57DRAFT_531912 [Linnemannia elongata]